MVLAKLILTDTPTQYIILVDNLLTYRTYYHFGLCLYVLRVVFAHYRRI